MTTTLEMWCRRPTTCPLVTEFPFQCGTVRSGFGYNHKGHMVWGGCSLEMGLQTLPGCYREKCPVWWSYMGGAMVWRRWQNLHILLRPVAFCIVFIYSRFSYRGSAAATDGEAENWHPSETGDQLGVFKRTMLNEAGCSQGIQPLLVLNKTPLSPSGFKGPPRSSRRTGGISGHRRPLWGVSYPVKSAFTLCLAVESRTEGHLDYDGGIFSSLVWSDPCFSQQLIIWPSLMMNASAGIVRSTSSKYIPVF